MLTQDEIRLVQSDWAQVVPIAAQAADLFYDRLFTLDPALKALFTSDLSEQKKKLLQMLGLAVKGLDDLGALVPAVQALGQRHSGYGVKPADYATVANALLWTLRQGIGGSFDSVHEAAWTKVYGVLSTTMIEASKPAMATGG